MRPDEIIAVLDRAIAAMEKTLDHRLEYVADVRTSFVALLDRFDRALDDLPDETQAQALRRQLQALEEGFDEPLDRLDEVTSPSLFEFLRALRTDLRVDTS